MFRKSSTGKKGSKETLVDSITESNTAAAPAGLLDQWKTNRA